jgi:hypothetical protein
VDDSPNMNAASVTLLETNHVTSGLRLPSCRCIRDAQQQLSSLVTRPCCCCLSHVPSNSTTRHVPSKPARIACTIAAVHCIDTCDPAPITDSLCILFGKSHTSLYGLHSCKCSTVYCSYTEELRVAVTLIVARANRCHPAPRWVQHTTSSTRHHNCMHTGQLSM